MHRVDFRIVGMSPLSQSRNIQTPKAERETSDDHERRVWRERCHVDDEGRVIIPPMMIKNCLSDAAKFLAMQIPGKGKATYTKHFEAGIMCMDPAYVMVRREGKDVPLLLKDVKSEMLFVPADGRRGGDKRVNKFFPVIPTPWFVDTHVIILDEMITKPVFKTHIERAGSFIGIGRFRPRRNGYYGRFNVKNIRWSALTDADFAADDGDSSLPMAAE